MEFKTNFLVDLYFTVPLKYANRDAKNADTSNIAYKSGLLNFPAIQKALSDEYYGISKFNDITLEIAQVDGDFSALELTQEFRGKGVRIRRYEPDEPVSGDKLKFEYYGIITDYDLLIDKIVFTISDPIQTLLPLKVYETTDWSQTLPQIYNPSYDLGKPYPLPFGYVKKSPSIYVHYDATNNWYDYIIARTGGLAIETNNSNKAITMVAYRSKVVIASSEFTVYDGSQVSPYPGYAFVRFILPQQDTGDNPYDMTFDFRGLKLGTDVIATRNVARQMQHLLNNATWGLNQPVNVPSFDTAATALASYLFDFSLSEQRNAEEILRELCYLCRGNLARNESGEWTLVIDTYQASDSARFEFGKHNISILENKRVSMDKAVKTYTLKYRPDPWTGDYSQKLTRNVLAFGEDFVHETPYVRDHTTADMIICFWQKFMIDADRKVTIEVDMDGRLLTEKNALTLAVPQLNINGRFQIRSISKDLEKSVFKMVSYTANIYNYSAGTLPTDEHGDVAIEGADFTFTPANPMTNLAVSGSGVHQGNDGGTGSWVSLTANAPASNFSYAEFGWKKTGDTGALYQWFSGQLASGVQWAGKLQNLPSGVILDYATRAMSLGGLPSTLITLLSQTSPDDMSNLPPQVGAPTGSAKLKTFFFSWAKSTDKRVGAYHVQLSAVSNFVPTVFDNAGVGGAEISFTSDTLAYAALYCRVKAVANAGQESALWSSTGSAIGAAIAPGDADPNGPAAPTSLVRTGEGVDQALDGGTKANMTFSWVNPVANWSYTMILLRKNGQSSWQIVGRTIGTDIRIDNLTPGIYYDITAQGVSAFSIGGALATTVTRLAPGDITPPAMVNSVVGSGKLKTWRFGWTKNTEADVKRYHVQIHTDSGFSNPIFDKVIDANSHDFTDDSLGYGTLYCRVKAVDFTGNESILWSSTASATTSGMNNGDLATNPNIQSLFPDGDFENGDYTKEFVISGDTSDHFWNEININRSGKYGLAIRGNGVGWIGIYSKQRYIPVKIGEVYYIEYYHRHWSAAGAVAGTSGVLVGYYDKNKNILGNDYTLADPGTSYRKGSNTIAISSCPVGTAFIDVFPCVAADMSNEEAAIFDDIILYKQKDTPFIQNNAVTIPVSAFTGAAKNLTDADTLVQTAVIISTGAPIKIFANCIVHNSANNRFILANIKCNGLVLYNRPDGEFSVASSAAVPILLVMDHMPGVGTWTYTFIIYPEIGLYGGSINASHSSLFVFEVKK